jgi:hypothetical protein
MSATRKLVLTAFILLALGLNLLASRRGPAIGSICPVLSVPRAADCVGE